MAASDLERPPFDFRREMRSVCVRAITMKKTGKITRLVMDQCNCNEVIAFIVSDLHAVKFHCFDRYERPVFTADCGYQFQSRRNINFWVSQNDGKPTPSWKVKHTNNNRYIAQKSPFNKEDPDGEFNIETYSNQENTYWLYTVTNELQDEVCIMRCERMTVNIIYYKSMDYEAKLLLLAFAAKRLHVNVNTARLPIPSILVSKNSPRADRKHAKGCIVAEADVVNLSAVVDVIFHRAGYNKALGIQYYDVFDRNTGVTQLTFEVSLDDKHNFTAALKNCDGTTILTASKLLTELNIKLKSEGNFTFETFNAFVKHRARFYDNDGNIFLEVRRSNAQVQGRMVKGMYRFYNSENTEGNETLQGAVRNRGPNNLYAVFKNEKINGRIKAFILAFAMRLACLDFKSDAVAMPPIDYCYGRRN